MEKKGLENRVVSILKLLLASLMCGLIIETFFLFVNVSERPDIDPDS